VNRTPERPNAKRLSLAEPITALRHVPIRECGEVLVNFLELCPDLMLDRPRFEYKRVTMLRRSVAEKLCEANRSLPTGYRLAVVEGWRAPHIQRRMYLAVWDRIKTANPDWSEVKLRRVVNRYTAPLDRRVPPPHSTGAAVDLILMNADGKPMDHTSPFDHHDPKCYSFDSPGLSDAARFTRQLMWDAITPTGLTNYPSEYWHWSYGDQGWAYRGGHANAIYGATQPDNWQPEPEELKEEPLVWLPSDR
jgi:D-alanyl-D-alanine dipeptidase